VRDKDQEWEDILEEIDLKFFPIEYLNKIIVRFDNGTVWDIDIDSNRQHHDLEDIEASLDKLFEEYDDSIEAVDFRLDIERVKRDLTKKVNRFLKKKL
jgi:hypothetical protein